MKKILIIEDNPIHAQVLVDILRDLDQSLQVYVTERVDKAYQFAMESTINLFLIDIILDPDVQGDVSGLTFAESIRIIPKYSFTPIIFITSLEDPKLHAYKDLRCYGYIEKPFEPAKVQEMISMALEFPEATEEDRNVYFRKDGIIYCFKKNDIVYVESSRRKVIIHTINDELTIPYKTTEQILEALNSRNFIQCSRYAIINKKYVKSIDYVNRFVRLKGVDREIEIGVSMKKRFRNEFWN